MSMPSLPRRRLPWDVLLLVVEQADRSTLAVLGRVSIDFLRATAPMLYREVEVKLVKQLEALFCEREEEAREREPSRVNNLLSLSQINNLSLNFASPSSLPNSTNPLHISTSRLDGSLPLPLDRLDLRCYNRYSTTAMLKAFYSSLFPQLNPTRCTYHALSVRNDGEKWIDLGGHLDVLRWPRLQQIEFDEKLPFIRLEGVKHLAALPRLSLLRRLGIRLNETRHPFESRPNWNRFLSIFKEQSVDLGLNSMHPGSLVFVVRSEEEKTDLEEAVLVNPRIAGWRSVLAVEVAL